MATGLAALGTGTATAQDVFGCKDAPVPTGPSSGAAGTLNPGIAEGQPFGQPLDGLDPYGTYGYGGLQWSTYDLGCGGSIRDPAAMVDTMFGNAFLGVAKSLFAAEQGLHELAADFDVTETVGAAARDSADPIREAIFSPWAGAALVVAASVMLVASHRGDIGEVMTRAAAILAAITIVALSFGSGAQLSVDLSGSLRTALNQTTQQVAQTAFPSGDLTGEESSDYGMSNVVYRELLWKAWKDGQVGVTGSEDRAWQLFEQQAFNRNEYQRVTDGSEGGQEQLVEQKGDRWKEIADEAPPMEYQSIQGRGDSRTSAGIFALAKVAPVSLLQIFASLVQYVMYVFLAFIPVAAPLVALLGIVRPNTPEKTVKVVGAVIFGGIVAAVVGMVHAIVVIYMARGELNSWGSILVIWITTAILFKLMKPIVSLTGIIESVRGGPGAIGGRAKRLGSWIKGERRFRAAVRVDAQRHGEMMTALRGTGDRPDGPRRGGMGGGPGGGPPGPPGPGDGGGPSDGDTGPRPDGPRGGSGGREDPTEDSGDGRSRDRGGPTGGGGTGPSGEDGPYSPDGPGGWGPRPRPSGGGGAGKGDQEGVPPGSARPAAPMRGADPTPVVADRTSDRATATPGRAAGNPAVTVARRAAAARQGTSAAGAGIGAYRPARAGRRPHSPGTAAGAPPLGAGTPPRKPR